MNDVLFEDYSGALTIEADVVEREREKSFTSYYENNEYLHSMYMKALQNHFDRLRDKWLADTNFGSNNYISAQHPAYIKIISLGESVVPLLLNDLAQNRTHWFTALTSITGENPIEEKHAGRINEMIGDWVHWGKQQGII